MKKIGLLSLLGLTSVYFSTKLAAQGAFATFNLGFAMPSASENIAYLDFTNRNSQGNANKMEQIYVSLGRGMNIGFAFGYMFNQHLGADLGISYFTGLKWEAVQKYDGGRTDFTLSSRMLRFKPNLVISAGTGGINPYAKMGCILSKGSVMYNFVDNDFGDVYEEKFKMSGGLAFGYTATAGATFTINERFLFFTELNLISMSYAPQKGIYTEVNYNGKDQLPSMDTRDTEFVFVKEYDNNQNPPPSEPSNLPRFRLPFGSMGLNIGLKIAL